MRCRVALLLFLSSFFPLTAGALENDPDRRDASFTGRDDLSQSRGTVGIYYTLLGHDRFGAVDWQTSAQ